MSFSLSAKDELARIRLKKNEKRALLMGATRAEGTMVLRSGSGIGVKFSMESMTAVKLISKLSAELYATTSEVSVHETNTGVGARNVVVCLFGEGVSALLTDCGLMSNDNATCFASAGDMKAYVRGVFLARGSVNDPNNSYHLELVCNTDALADTVSDYCSAFGVSLKSTARGNDCVLYIKDSEVISDFLKLIGAVNSTLELENVITERDMNNYVNRATNCDMANVKRTVTASTVHIRAIEIIGDSGVILPLPLQEVASVRLQYPEASLAELAAILGIGKSCLSHRLSKIVAIAEDIGLHS